MTHLALHRFARLHAGPTIGQHRSIVGWAVALLALVLWGSPAASLAGGPVEPEANPAVNPGSTLGLDSGGTPGSGNQRLESLCLPVWINLAVNNHNETEIPFMDLFKLSDYWHNGNWISADARITYGLDLDEKGWVKSIKKVPGPTSQVVRTFVLGPAAHHAVRMMSPMLVMRYEGQGKIEVYGAKTISETPGRTVMQLNEATPNGEDALIIAITDIPNPNNYPKNITIKPLEYEYDNSVFNPTFIERMYPFKGVRFMNPGQTNTWNGQKAYVQRWNDRPTIDDIRWSDQKRGMPLEVMAEMCNAIARPMWVCIHHTADQEYIDNAAKLIHDRLHPSLQVVVEHSNEVWNGIFQQAQDCEKAGVALGLGKPKHTNYNAVETRLKYHALRTTFIGERFKMFMGSRHVTRMLAMGIPLPGYNETILEFDNTKNKIDAVSIAPYFGGKYGNSHYEHWSVDQLMDDLIDVEIPGVVELTAWNHSVVKKANPNLEFWFYEWGQHMVAGWQFLENKPLNALMDAAQKSDRMEEAYLEAAKAFATLNPSGMAHFTFSASMNKFGRWGLLEHVSQSTEEAPKYRAIMQAIACEP